VSVVQRLRDFQAPAEPAAQERAHAVARAAFERRPPARRRRVPAGPLALAAAAVALAAAIALTPPGEAVAGWVHDLVTPDPPRAAPALTSLPAPGRLLLTGPGGTWVVQHGGSARRIGAYEDATWSPHGLFIGVTRGRSLMAVEPRGNVRWTLARREPVSQPAWAPSGFRVAYRAGRSIRVVAGDGSGDRLLARFAGPAAPVWKPGGNRHVLAYVERDGVVVARDTDTGGYLWRSSPGHGAVELEWVSGGRSLAVIRGDELQVLAGNGRVRFRVPLRGSGVSLADRPGRTDVAISVVGRDGTGRVLLQRVRGSDRPQRVLLAAPGPIAEVAFSPDGSTVLVARGAGEWVFLPVGRGRVRAVRGIAGQFDPRPQRPRGMPTIRGWASP
jgi:hypothetical protein